MKMRRFRAGEGRVYTLPSGLKGATNGVPTRLACPMAIAAARDPVGMVTELELDFDNFEVQRHTRDIAIALANGDFVEVTEAAAPIAAPAVSATPAPSSPPPFVVNPGAKPNPGAIPSKGAENAESDR